MEYPFGQFGQLSWLKPLPRSCPHPTSWVRREHWRDSFDTLCALLSSSQNSCVLPTPLQTQEWTPAQPDPTHLFTWTLWKSRDNILLAQGCHPWIASLSAKSKDFLHVAELGSKLQDILYKLITNWCIFSLSSQNGLITLSVKNEEDVYNTSEESIRGLFGVIFVMTR